MAKGAVAVFLLAGWLVPLFASTPHLTEAQRISIIRALVAEVGIARKPLPPDKHGIEIAPDGRVLNPDDVQSAILDHGVAARVGDRLAITAILFKDDNIIFVINGGPHKTHWYDHLQIGLGGGGMQPASQTDTTGPHGAQITLHFEDGVPPLTPAAVKHDLATLIDWAPPRVAKVMVKALPAPVKAAIAQHQVLVGMNTDMVEAALGRTGNKIRETDPSTGVRYEDWIYGTPPQPTIFVRLVSDRVVRVTTYRPDGSKTVETQPDPALAAAAAQSRPESASAGSAAEANRGGDQPPPTLRRPGDPAPVQGRGAAPPPNMPPPGLPPGGGIPAPSPSTPGTPPSSSPFPGAPTGCCG